MSHDEQILVMGVGNPMMRDEGAGPRTVEILMASYDFPPNVEVVDCGTMGYMILDVIRNADHLIIVDALKDPDLSPGDVVRLEPSEFAPNQVMHSMHDVRLPEVLKSASLIGHSPKTVAIGIQIERIEEWVLELSPAVEAALPTAVAAVLEELKALGVEPTARTDVSMDASIIESVRSYRPIAPDAYRPADGTKD